MVLEDTFMDIVPGFPIVAAHRLHGTGRVLNSIFFHVAEMCW